MQSNRDVLVFLDRISQSSSREILSSFDRLLFSLKLRTYKHCNKLLRHTIEINGVVKSNYHLKISCLWRYHELKHKPAYLIHLKQKLLADRLQSP